LSANELRSEHLRLLLMATLTFVTGIVDGVGFVGLDHVFAGTATGNVLILGMALGGGSGLPVFGPLAALVAFGVGALAAGLVLRSQPDHRWVPAITSVLLINAIILAVLAVTLGVTDEAFDRTVQIVVSSTTALVMGAQAAVGRRLAVTGMNSLVITLSIVSWASESLVRPSRSLWDRRLVAVLVLFLGALIGVALMRVHIGVPMALAAIVVLTVATIGHRTIRSANPTR